MIPGKEEFLKKQRFREETLFQKSRQRELPAFHMGKIKSIHKTTRPLDIPESGLLSGIRAAHQYSPSQMGKGVW
jgi:hypothetical protein